MKRNMSAVEFLRPHMRSRSLARVRSIMKIWSTILRVPFFSVVYFSRGTLPTKKDPTRARSWGTQIFRGLNPLGSKRKNKKSRDQGALAHVGPVVRARVVVRVVAIPLAAGFYDRLLADNVQEPRSHTEKSAWSVARYGCGSYPWLKP